MIKSEKERMIKEAQRQLNAKLRLERKFSDGVRKFLRRQNKAAMNHAKQFSYLYDAYADKQELDSLLTEHYYNVLDKASPSVIKELNSTLSDSNIEKVDDDNPAVLASLALFISQSVSTASMQITDRSNRDISKFFSTNEPKEAKKQLDAGVLRRSQAIATQHTQIAYEGGKEVLSRAAGNVAQNTIFFSAVLRRDKTWMTRQDPFVRPWHASALFQTVETSKPFIVGGEEMMYPGDLSMGASIKNVANCRCVALYSTKII